MTIRCCIFQVSALPLRYRPPVTSPVSLKKETYTFRVNRSLLQFLGIPPKEFANVSNESAKGFVFVTASSRNHFLESKDLIAGIQRFYPHKAIIYYNLGLSYRQKKQVRHLHQYTFNYVHRYNRCALKLYRLDVKYKPTCNNHISTVVLYNKHMHRFKLFLKKNVDVCTRT